MTTLKNLSTLSTLGFLSMAALLFSSCGLNITGAAESIQQLNSAFGNSRLAVNVNAYPSNKLTCNPLTGGGTTSTSFEKGIKAELFYKTVAMPIMHKSTDFVQFAKKSDQNIFLSDINIPTRMFTEGFANASGTFLKTDSGEKLIEYFGLNMKTNLILGAEETSGEYELALLSDDGSTLTLTSGSQDSQTNEVLINNDGDHPTKMGCATRTIRMIKNVMQPISMTYYQGPRYHIANVLIWRKSAVAGQDPLCNQEGNNLFFNPDNQSSPQQAFKDLESRGWKILTPENYMVSLTKTDYNPCVTGTNPVITNFHAGEATMTSMSFQWNTDILATSQIQLTNVSTGEVTTTTSDNILRLDNNILLSNLQPQTTYKAQAISVSADLGRTISMELIFKTH